MVVDAEALSKLIDALCPSCGYKTNNCACVITLYGVMNNFSTLELNPFIDEP